MRSAALGCHLSIIVSFITLLFPYKFGKTVLKRPHQPIFIFHSVFIAAMGICVLHQSGSPVPSLKPRIPPNLAQTSETILRAADIIHFNALLIFLKFITVAVLSQNPLHPSFSIACSSLFIRVCYVSGNWLYTFSFLIFHPVSSSSLIAIPLDCFSFDSCSWIWSIDKSAGHCCTSTSVTEQESVCAFHVRFLMHYPLWSVCCIFHHDFSLLNLHFCWLPFTRQEFFPSLTSVVTFRVH